MGLAMWFAMLLGLVVFCPATSAAETYRLKVHYSMVQQTVCAHYVYDSLDSCESAKAWFEEVSAWHGKNNYWCVLDSECQ